MDCRDFEYWLSRQERNPERGYTGDASEHLKDCPSCQQLMMLLASTTRTFQVRPELLHVVEARITADLRPVRPMRSAMQTGLTLAAIVLSFIGVFSRLLRPFGLSLMGPAASAVVLLGLAMSGGSLIYSLTRQMMPSSLSRIRPGFLTIAVVAGLGFLMVALFPYHPSPDFWSKGWPCLGVGLGIATLAGGAILVILNQGAVLYRQRAGLTTGLLAGLAGLAVLEIHCPVLETLHAMTWHLGGASLAAFVGAGCGRLADRFSGGQSS